MSCPVSRTKHNVVPAGPSQLLVCSKLSTTLKTIPPNPFLSPNNNSLTVAVLKVSVAKVAMVLGPLMLFLTFKSSVLSRKVNTPTLLEMELARPLSKTLVSSLPLNSKFKLLMLPYKLLSKSNLSPSVLMLLDGLVTYLVPSKTVLPTLMMLITLSSSSVLMLMVPGRSETLGVLLGVKLVISLLPLVTLVVLKTTLSSPNIEEESIKNYDIK